MSEPTTTDWNPRIVTGLNGARYPEEDLEPHAPDGRSLKSPGVYFHSTPGYYVCLNP